MTTDEEIRQVGHVVERLVRKHPEVAREAIAAAVHDAHSHFDGCRIRDFVPLFVERRAHEQLRSGMRTIVKMSAGAAL
ncbi:hypothetical protein JOJ86_005874 [Rhodococcus percolatus]|uniref:three-helix bundle dimerization domain-containing protein n=1 Tax=Rhodococcus opacus TaxID=37919 RepID=UPI001AE526D4|nr:hypothetical protein [Rhodococcus opacus]MBP2208148.1 hypothetical protein [Rhodococcus opacus]